jgi:predicted nucleic acid-binding protein
LDLVADTTDGVLPWQVACEFIAASRKLAEQGFTAAHAWQRLAEFLALFPLIMPTPAVLERARALHLQQQWAFWDATLVSACIESGVKRLYSEDLPGRTKIQSLEIVSPFA